MPLAHALGRAARQSARDQADRPGLRELVVAAEIGDHADVDVLAQFVRAQHAQHAVREVVALVDLGVAHQPHAEAQPLEVLGQAEHEQLALALAPIAADALEHAAAVLDDAREGVDPGVLVADDLAVQAHELGGRHAAAPVVGRRQGCAARGALAGKRRPTNFCRRGPTVLFTASLRLAMLACAGHSPDQRRRDRWRPRMPLAAASGPDRASSSPPAAKRRAQAMAQDPRPLPRPRPDAQPLRARDHRGAVLRAVGADAVLPRPRLLAQPDHRGAGRGLPRAAVHDPARLRPRLVLPPAGGQPLGRALDRRADADALRLLAAHPCDPSRRLRQPRPARHRRRHHADGRRVPRPVALAAARLPAGAQPADPARRSARSTSSCSSIACRSS